MVQASVLLVPLGSEECPLFWQEHISHSLHTGILWLRGELFILVCAHQACEVHVQPNGTTSLLLLSGEAKLPCHQ